MNTTQTAAPARTYTGTKVHAILIDANGERVGSLKTLCNADAPRNVRPLLGETIDCKRCAKAATKF
jgi:hypothetical protein